MGSRIHSYPRNVTVFRVSHGCHEGDEGHEGGEGEEGIHHRSRGSYEGHEGHEGGEGEEGIHHRNRCSYEGNEGSQGEEGISDRSRGGYEGNEGHESGEGVAFFHLYACRRALTGSDCHSGHCTIFALPCRAPATGPCIGEIANSAAPELASIEVVKCFFFSKK